MFRLEPVDNTPFVYYTSIHGRLAELDRRVEDLRSAGESSSKTVRQISIYLRIWEIHHSNAIEGNSLTFGETSSVVKQGLTVTGKSLRDQIETTSLFNAMDFMEDLTSDKYRPITLSDLRQLHALVLKGTEDDYAGRYRTGAVKISGSDYSPPPAERVPHEMAELGDYIGSVASSSESLHAQPIVCAAAAHAWLAQIHPFADGNGRTARLLMNLILRRHDYPICIIRVQDRLRYIQALEDSQTSDLTPLLELLIDCVEDSVDAWSNVAADREQRELGWHDFLGANYTESERNKARNEHGVMLRGMELFKSYMKQTAYAWNEDLAADGVAAYFRDYGTLDFYSYLRLRDGDSAKRTWDFGIEFRRSGRRARYLFFFGAADDRLKERSRVALILAKDIDHRYERVQYLSQPNTPDMFQVAFDMTAQTFVALKASGEWTGKAGDLARTFLEQVIERDFGA